MVATFCAGVGEEKHSSQTASEETDFAASHLALHEKLFIFGQSEMEMMKLLCEEIMAPHSLCVTRLLKCVMT